MKKNILILASLLILASCTGKEFTFVHITDTQVGFMDKSEHYAVSDSLLKDAVDAINRLKPVCVVVTGDLIDSRKNEEERAIYEKRMGEIDPSIPVYATPGNHDIPKIEDDIVKDYLDFIGYDRFSFVKKGCAFIGIDSNRIKAGECPAEQEQYDWLEAELKKAQGKKHIFLFFHCPVILASMDEPDNYENFPTGLREKYLSLFKKYGVEAIFTGHTHRCIGIDLDGIKSITAGPVAHSFEERGSGLNVVKVTPDGLDCQFLKGKDISGK